MTDLWRPLWLSLRIACCATAVIALIAIPLAWFMARRRFPGKSLLEALIAVPLVLPPTVVGYFIIVVLGKRGWLGHWFHDYSILFTFEGAVLSATVVALPMLYLPAKAAFASIPREMEEFAVLMGASRWQRFRDISLPLARRGLLSGLLLAFARSLGEFGATAMVFGRTTRVKTLPIFIFDAYESGEILTAVPAVIALTAISLGLIVAYNFSAAGRQE